MSRKATPTPLATDLARLDAFVAFAAGHDDLYDLLAATGDDAGVVLPTDWHRWKGPRAAGAVAALRASVRRLLADVVDAGQVRQQGRALALGMDDAVPVGPSMRVRLRVGRDGRVVPHLGGHLRALVLFRLIAVLVAAPADLVNRCPECGAFFVRRRRQQYCSRPCTNKATWRRVPPEVKHQYRRNWYDGPEGPGYVRGGRVPFAVPKTDLRARVRVRDPKRRGGFVMVAASAFDPATHVRFKPAK